jgi:hypothetical protein
VALGKGMTLAADMEGRRQVVEGAATAPAVLARAGKLDIEMPICAAGRCYPAPRCRPRRGDPRAAGASAASRRAMKK